MKVRFGIISVIALFLLACLQHWMYQDLNFLCPVHLNQDSTKATSSVPKVVSREAYVDDEQSARSKRNESDDKGPDVVYAMDKVKQTKKDSILFMLPIMHYEEKEKVMTTWGQYADNIRFFVDSRLWSVQMDSSPLFVKLATHVFLKIVIIYGKKSC